MEREEVERDREIERENEKTEGEREQREWERKGGDTHGRAENENAYLGNKKASHNSRQGLR